MGAYGERKIEGGMHPDIGEGGFAYLGKEPTAYSRKETVKDENDASIEHEVIISGDWSHKGRVTDF